MKWFKPGVYLFCSFLGIFLLELGLDIPIILIIIFFLSIFFYRPKKH